jgi:hypothetical protein
MRCCHLMVRLTSLSLRALTKRRALKSYRISGLNILTNHQ